MAIFALLALAAAPLDVPFERAAPQAVAQALAPGRQASATVTILPAASLRFADIERDRPQSLRQSLVRDADGSAETVRLVEFE